MLDRKELSSNPAIQPVRKNIVINDWGPFFRNLDNIRQYNTDVQTLEINNLIRSTAKAIDPDTENNFNDLFDRLFPHKERKPKKKGKAKKQKEIEKKMKKKKCLYTQILKKSDY